MEKIAEIKGFRALSDIIENLGREFDFPKLTGLSYLVFPSAPISSSVNVSLVDEIGLYNASTVTLSLHQMEYDPHGSEIGDVGRLRFHWETASFHLVEISGSWRTDDSDDSYPTFEVWIGEDESKTFYPKVKRIINGQYERMFVDAYWGSPDNIKTFVLPVGVRAEVGDWVLCDGESNIQKISRIFRAVKPEIEHAVYQNVSEMEGQDRWSTMEISEAENVLLKSH